MPGRILLAGVETRSLELRGHMEPAHARRLVGSGLRVRDVDGAAELELLAFRMHRLGLAALPWPGLGYGEVLFRVGVEWGGAPAWFAVCCVLDGSLIAGLARRLIRYPVRRVDRIDVDEHLAVVDRGRTILAATIGPRVVMTDMPAPVRPLLLRAGDLLQVPWAETPAQRWSAAVTVDPGPLEQTVLGCHAVWTSAVVHAGRRHRCGLATHIRAQP